MAPGWDTGKTAQLLENPTGRPYRAGVADRPAASEAADLPRCTRNYSIIRRINPRFENLESTAKRDLVHDAIGGTAGAITPLQWSERHCCRHGDCRSQPAGN